MQYYAGLEMITYNPDLLKNSQIDLLSDSDRNIWPKCQL